MIYLLMINIGFPYYFFGSHNSLDVDVLVEHPETSDKAVAAIKVIHPATKDWNMSLIGIEDGRVIRTMAKRGSPDAGIIAYIILMTIITKYINCL